MILKRKEVVAAALVVLIGVAGYLNWSYQDEIRVTDGEIYAETGKRLGEAQYVSTTKSDVEDKDKADTKETAKEDKSKDKEDSKKEDKKEDSENAKAECGQLCFGKNRKRKRTLKIA